MAIGNARKSPQAWVQQSKSAAFNTLIIGDIARWSAGGRQTTAFTNFEFCTLKLLNTDLLRDFAPNMILSPLVGDNFDVLDIAASLRRLGFKGCYRAISQPMPDAEVIRAEVRAVAPELDFDLLLIPLNDD